MSESDPRSGRTWWEIASSRPRSSPRSVPRPGWTGVGSPTLPSPDGPREDPDGWRCAPLTLPEPFAQKLVALASHLGLRYSAMDLIRREDGEFVFLEANDGGAWGWIEERTKLPLTEAIADLLVAAAHSTSSPSSSASR